MSKADGWEKKSRWEWRKSGPTFRAEIGKYLDTAGTPYLWDVYPIPRSRHIDSKGRYRPVGTGRCAKLADAKSEAQIAIDHHLQQSD